MPIKYDFSTPVSKFGFVGYVLIITFGHKAFAVIKSINQIMFWEAWLKNETYLPAKRMRHLDHQFRSFCGAPASQLCRTKPVKEIVTTGFVS